MLEKEVVLHPVNSRTVIQYQQNDEFLIEIAKSNKDYITKHFHKADKNYSLIYRKHKIVIPRLLGENSIELFEKTYIQLYIKKLF